MFDNVYRVPYIALTRTLEIIEDTSARLKMVEILSNYFRSVIALSPNDLIPSVYLCLNQLAPAYEGENRVNNRCSSVSANYFYTMIFQESNWV